MHRNNLLKLLDQYQPSCFTEEAAKQQMISFIKANEDCFQRSLEAGHITASAWILNHTEDQALLMHHKKLDNWFQLGGHCDGESDVLTVALKEAREESGTDHIIAIKNEIFDIDIHLIPANSREKQHYHYDIRFLLKVTNDSPLPGNAESKALQWVGKDVKHLPTSDPSILRMFNKWEKRAN